MRGQRCIFTPSFHYNKSRAGVAGQTLKRCMERIPLVQWIRGLASRQAKYIQSKKWNECKILNAARTIVVSGQPRVWNSLIELSSFYDATLAVPAQLVANLRLTNDVNDYDPTPLSCQTYSKFVIITRLSVRGCRLSNGQVWSGRSGFKRPSGKNKLLRSAITTVIGLRMHSYW